MPIIETLITKPDGSVYMNPLRPYVRGNFIAPSANNYPVAIAAQSGINAGKTAPITFEASQDGTTEILGLMGENSAADNADVVARQSVIIEDMGWRRKLMNRDILCKHVFGTAQNPFFLMESIFLQPQQTLQSTFFNNSTAGAASWYFNGHGRKYQNTLQTNREGRKFIEDNYERKAYLYPYWLTSDIPITLAAAGSKTVFFKITDDMDFVAFKFMLDFITTGVAGDVVQGVSVQLFDPTTDKPMQNSPRTGRCQFGTGTFPFLTQGWLMQPRTILKAVFTNLVTDQETEVFPTFHGVARYRGKANFAQDAGVRPVEQGPTHDTIRTAVQ